ncbi:hypothetical protein [Parapontixanthobacter aurantiacus]|nr:hypothetical protein [Parapontixanthobacter aurantiacus]
MSPQLKFSAAVCTAVMAFFVVSAAANHGAIDAPELAVSVPFG